MINLPGVIDECIGDGEASGDKIRVGPCNAQQLDSEGTMQLGVANCHWKVAAAFLHNLTTSVQFPAADHTIINQAISEGKLSGAANTALSVNHTCWTSAGRTRLRLQSTLHRLVVVRVQQGEQ